MQRIFGSILKLLVFILGLLSLYGFILYLNIPDVASLATSNPPTTSFIELRRTQANQNKIPFDLRWEWVPLSKISPSLVQSVINAEDITFWKHHGIEWNQIRNALNIFWHQQRFVTGGSTITQQLAKNLYLSPDRTLLRKCQEFLIAIELERHLSKERILEIYLNVAEWGDQIFGIEAASQYWFGCSANDLKPYQAINLALIVPSPLQRNPTNPPTTFRRGIDQLLLMLAEAGIISDELAIEELNIPMPSEPLNEEKIYKIF